MKIEVKVPELPESVADGVLLAWHKAVGDPIGRDENLIDLETDKVVLEIPAPDTGVLVEIAKQEGDIVTSGELLAILDTEATAIAPSPGSEDASSSETETSDTAQTSPAVRKLLDEHQLDASQIKGSGKEGRIIKQDVLDYVASQSTAPAPEPAAPKEQTMAKPSMPMNTAADGRVEERVPMTRLRAKIAERLIESQQTAAILTTFNEVNMQPIMDLRAKYQDQFVKKHGTKLGFMSFFVRACTEALKQYPVVNASVEDNDIIYHGFYDIGIAVGSPRGLVVPILRDTDSMGFADIENTIKDFGVRAQEGKLGLEELSGGTFSITNGGIFGSMLSTPIINPPQSAILGMHNIQQRAVVENGEVVARPVMYLALSYDHRIIDGRDAVQFLVSVKRSLEDPAAMLLDL